MRCIRPVGKACRNHLLVATPRSRKINLHVYAVASKKALVVGGGFAGLAAAQVLTDAGADVVLVEQGRGLGGRMCTRTVSVGANERITFDHGCQYVTPRNPLFEATLNDLAERGVVAQWGRGRPVGDAFLADDDTVDLGSFQADTQKALWVGTPTNSAVGRALAARAGPRLHAMTATRVEALQWDETARRWRCKARAARADGEGVTEGAIVRLEAAAFDMVVTALSSVSTGRLLQRTTTALKGPGGEEGTAAPLAADIVAAADTIQSNVCWALMVALNKKLEVPFDGAMISKRTPAGSPPAFGSIAWVARDSDKPGRPPVAGGAGEAWVVHGGPDWSNQRRDVAPKDVAAELLRDFAHLVQAPISPSDVVHVEAHRWNNAYPLNPRGPDPRLAMALPSSTMAVGGHFMLHPEVKLGVCGDWCKGPRAADTYVTGWEVANALLHL